MKIVIFGLGSMGKRRARCLMAMGEHEIYGYDVREDRVLEAKTLGIQSMQQLEELPLSEAQAYLICTPPDNHEFYLMLALEYAKPTFVEASVLLGKLSEIDLAAKKAKLLIAPSCTMTFHPAIKQIKAWIDSGQYGKVSNFSYHCGQYLPDWHPWEKVSDFYVSNPSTGGAREIVPFELTWIVSAFGTPQNVSGFYGETIDVGAPIADSYAIALAFEKVFGVMMVDVSARYGLRNLTLNFERAQVQWRWDENKIRLFDAQSKNWQEVMLAQGSAATGYNPNIHEKMYEDEMRAFLKAISTQSIFPNTLAKDIAILQLLQQIEKGTL